MPNYWSSHGVGRVRATELDQFFVPYGWRHDQSKRCVIWGHGAGGTYQVGPIERLLMEALGCVWVAATCGGGNSNLKRFGDDNACADVVSAFNVAKTLFNVMPDKYVFWGGSMGGLTGPCAAFSDPSKCAAVGGAIPAVDPEYVRTADVNGNKAAIETVYGANPVPAAKQIYQRGAAWSALGIPLAWWYATDDVFTPLASYQAFIAAAGSSVESHSMGAVGHNYLGIAVPEVIGFLGRYVA